jgi:hypothetical protein
MDVIFLSSRLVVDLGKGIAHFLEPFSRQPLPRTITPNGSRVVSISGRGLPAHSGGRVYETVNWFGFLIGKSSSNAHHDLAERLRNRLLPRWGKRMALRIQPLEVEELLSAVKEAEVLENQLSTR